MTSYNPVVKNASGGAILYTALFPRTPTGQTQDNPTLASGDVKISIDGGSYTNLGTLPSVSPAGSDNVKITLSQAETNGDNITIRFRDQAGAEWCDQHIALQTVAANFDALNTKIDTIDGNVDDILTDTGTTLPGTLATIDNNVDAILVDTGTTLPASLSTIDNNVDAILTDTGTTIPGLLATIDSNVDAILVDTAEIGAAGAGLTEAGGTGDHLTAIPWNASWDAEVQSEVADGLAAYDPPTKAELDAAVSPLATATALATVDNNVDAILVDTAEIGTAGAGLTNVTINGLSAAALADFFTTDSGQTYGDAVSGSVVAEIADNAGGGGGSAPTVEEIAAEVWSTATRTITALDEDSTTIDLDATIRAAVGLASANLDTQLTTIDGNVDDILTDTGTAGVVVASGSKSGYSLAADQSGVTVGTVNALGTQAKADVNAEADTALADYDPPTRAEATSDKNEVLSAISGVDGKVDTVDGVVDAILVDTAVIGAAGAGLTAIPWNASWDAEVQSECADALAAYDPPTKAELDSAVSGLATASELGDVSAVTDKLDTMIEDSTGYRFTEKALEEAPSGGGSAPTVGEIADAVWNEAIADHQTTGTAGEALYVGATRDIPWNSDWDAEVQSEVTDALNAYDPPTRSEATADKAEILSAVGDVPTANENADALLDRSNGVETGLTPRGALRLTTAALAGKASGLATTTATFRNAVADSKARITATVDEDGNRSAVTTDTT